MPGGRIPPDGRPPQAPGIGRNAKRHDLETPRLQGSDLQYGEIQEVQEGQRQIRAVTEQPPAAPQPPASGGQPAPQGGGGIAVPEPISFAAQKIGGTLTPQPPPKVARGVNTRVWSTVYADLLSTGKASSKLKTALLQRVGEMMQAPYVPKPRILDMDDADAAVEAFANAL